MPSCGSLWEFVSLCATRPGRGLAGHGHVLPELPDGSGAQRSADSTTGSATGSQFACIFLIVPRIYRGAPLFCDEHAAVRFTVYL